MSKNIIVFRNAADFRNYAAESGRNNAARALYRQFLRLNNLDRNELIQDSSGLTVGKDNRQQVLIGGCLYGVSVNDKGDCRQYDSDYVGLINISPTTGRVLLAFTNDLSLHKKPNLIRTKGNNASYNAALSEDASVELENFKVWDNTTPEQNY